MRPVIHYWKQKEQNLKNIGELLERFAKVASNSGMLLMACDQCAYEREIDGMLVDGATIGCFPNLYSALSGNMPDFRLVCRKNLIYQGQGHDVV